MNQTISASALLVLVALVAPAAGCSEAAKALDANNDQPGSADRRAVQIDQGADFTALAVDDQALLYADYQSLHAVPAAGGAPKAVGSIDRPKDSVRFAGDRMLLDATSIYLGTPAGVFITPRAGGPARKIVKDSLIGLAQSDTSLFYAVQRTGAILRADKTTLAEDNLVSGLGAVTDIAGDDTNLYFTDSDKETVSVVPKAGGDVKVLASNQARPALVAVSAGFVYWYNDVNSDHPDLEGRIFRIAKDGSGAPQQLLETASSPPERLASDDQFLYYITSGIWRVPAAGGASEKFANGAIVDFSLFGDSVYWVEDNSYKFSDADKALPAHVRKATR